MSTRRSSLSLYRRCDLCRIYKHPSEVRAYPAGWFGGSRKSLCLVCIERIRDADAESAVRAEK